MARNSLISGSVLQFTLPNKLGFAYGKIFDFRYIREFDGVIVKVFEHIAPEPISDISVLQGKDWLFGARRMPWLPKTRGNGAWKYLGIMVSQNDSIIPDFRYSRAASHKAMLTQPWQVVRNINQYSDELYSYDKVKHLENIAVYPEIAIEIRTAMEYLRIRGVDIASQFDLKLQLNKVIYEQMIGVTIYKEVPPEIRDRVVSE